VVFTRNNDDAAQQALRTVGADIESQPAGDEALDLHAVCARRAALEFNEVLVESGPVLAGALLDAGLVDELVIYLAPMLLGASARSAFATLELLDLSDAKRFQCVETRSIGRDLRLTLTPALA
jgi:diaminohydroxyphosphoribosylaminopyrimidine deaminase/5-amino-6-(5-phosphoribosylamino)uracil reductase